MINLIPPPIPPLPTYQQGVALRDYFAATAMQGMLAACTGWSEAQQERLAKCSYAMADAMLKERGREE